MTKFKVGDKVRVIDDEKLLEEENLTNKQLAPLLGIEFDTIKPDMVGVVKQKGLTGGHQYLVDFGEGFNGIDNQTEGYKGTNIFVTDKLLELVETSEGEPKTHNEVEEDETTFTMKLKDTTAILEINDNGKTYSFSRELNSEEYFKLRMMFESVKIASELGDVND